jgi:hypothetical protein
VHLLTVLLLFMLFLVLFSGCGILMETGKNGQPVRMGVEQPEPEPEAEPNDDGTDKPPIACPLYDGWIYNSSSTLASSTVHATTAEPEPGPEPEPASLR